MSEATRQRSIVLILARDLASTLATPTMIVDADGRIVYYNDAAGDAIGRPFNEAAPMTREQILEAVHTMDEEGLPIDFAGTPLGIVLGQHRASHQVLTMTNPGGVTQRVEVTAFPLYARPDELVGGVAVFWNKRKER